MLKTVSSITNAIGALNFKGTWNASTNTPTIVSSVGVKGDYYVVSVAGTTTINGISNWGVGDWITYNGSVWQRVEGGADLNGVNLSVSGTTTLSGLTASTALALDASKNVVSVTNTGTGDNVLGTSPTITTPRVVTSINDTNGNEVLGITATASAVNELTIANAATGNNPVISTTGGDTNIGITLTPKGTGGVAVTKSLSVTGQANFVTGVASPNMTIGNTGNGDTGFIMSWLSTDSASVKNWQWTFNNYSAGMSLLSSTTSGSSAFVLNDTLWNVKDTGQQTITDKPAANTSAFKFLSFVSNSAEAGSITRVGQTAVVTYNTSSDYRLKKNQTPLTGSGEFIDALKPKTWEWVSGGGKASGFIAHEFAEVSPSSVSGEKDATQEEEYIDSSGVKRTRTVPLYQGMQASSSEVMANLVAEIQSLRKRVAALEAAQ